VRELAADLLDAPPAGSLLTLADSLQGHPFLLVQLLGGLRAEGRLRVEEGLVSAVGTQLPSRLRDSMRLRLNRLSARAGQAVVAGAVLGSRFSHGQLAAVLGVDGTELLEPAAELVGEGLLAEHGDRLAFPHDLVREAVLQTVPPPRRRVLERRVVDVLMAEGTAPVEVAERLAASAEPGDRAAVSVLSRAAQALAGTNIQAAADLGPHALGLLTEDDALRGPLVAQTAVLLYLAGRSVEGVALAQGALTTILPEEQKAEIYLTIAVSAGVPAEVREQACRHGLTLSGLSDALRFRLRVLLGYNLIHVGDTDQALTALPELAGGRPAADDPAADDPVADDPVAAQMLFAARQSLAVIEDRYADALASALGFDVNGGLGDASLRMTHVIVDTLALQDRFAEAERILGLGLEQSERSDQLMMVHTFERLRGRLWASAGRLPDALAVLEPLCGSEETKPGNSVEAASLAVLGRVAWQTGQEALARRTARRAEDVARTMAGEAGQQARVFLAYLRMADSDAAGARDLLIQGSVLLPRFAVDPGHAVEVVRIGRACGDADLVRRGVETAERRAARNPGVGSLAGFALHARGLAEEDTDALREAVSLLSRGHRRLAYASALEDLGGREQGEASAAAWGAAFDLYEESGAVWDAGRVRGRLRAVGVRRAPGGGRDPGAWGGLTAAELDVVRLVARGGTNREVAKELFLSPYTVNSHLRGARSDGDRADLGRGGAPAGARAGDADPARPRQPFVPRTSRPPRTPTPTGSSRGCASCPARWIWWAHGWGGLLVLRAVTGLGLRVRSWVVDDAGGFHTDAEPDDLSLLQPAPEVALRRLLQAPAGSPDRMIGMLRLLGAPTAQAEAMGAALDASMAGCAVDLHRSADPNVRAGWDLPTAPEPLARGLVVMPGADPYGAQTLAREVAAQLGAQTRALDGLGHFWMLEDPGQAADLLNRFWQGLEQ
jgi:tetratricopeptide (TPR) repeat protein